MKKIIGAVVLAAGMALSGGSASAACGKVTIADMNWSSATVMANVDRFILEHGFGCQAELVPGDTMPTGTSMMEKGEPDIAPELWTNSFAGVINKAVEEKRLVIAGNSLSDGGEEGFWVPRYLVDKQPELGTIQGIIANAKMFEHPEEDDKSAFYGCPAGWGCQISSGNLFKALKLADRGFEYVDPGSGAGLAGSIAKAFEAGKPWFGYYWAPTGVLGKYDMVMVDFGSGVKADYFKDCIAKPDCDNTKVSMYPPSPVLTVTTADFAKKSPEAFAYLEKRAFTNRQMNSLLAWMEDNQADGNIAMEEFLLKNEAIWTKWVSEDVAAKVKKALSEL